MSRNKKKMKSKSKSDASVDTKTKEIIITLDKNECECFEPRVQEVHKRSKLVQKTFLQVGWSNVLFQILNKHILLKCIINFKRADVYTNGEFRAIGYCPECEAKYKIESKNKRSVLVVSITKGKGKHTGLVKRRLLFGRLDDLKMKLKHKAAYNIRNEMCESEENKNIMRRNVPTLNAMKQIRKKRNAEMPRCLTTSLRKMMYSPEFYDCIKEIATDPFHLFYWTPFQKAWFMQHMKHERVVLSIDATGSIVLPINANAELEIAEKIPTAAIFLYLIVAKTSTGSSVPVGQMLSADQHSK